MNFSALRQDKLLWPTNDAPFALLVAQNVAPKKGDSFYFLSPRHEGQLAQLGQFRIDPMAALPISLQIVREKPHAFKALYKGSKLGLDLIERVFAASTKTAKQALSDHGLAFASGYQIGKPERRTQATDPMRGLPEAALDMMFEVPSYAARFELSRVQWARSPKIYEGPLLLFRESPKLDRNVRGALFAEQSTVYRENFLGLSFASKPELTLLRDLLYVLSYSDLVLYYQLLTSSKFGVERDSALQIEFESFPLVDLQVAQAHEKKIAHIASSLRSGNRCWAAVDSLAAELYELSEADQDLIRDTLGTELPFTEIQRNADASASNEHFEQFMEMFNRIIRPYVTDGECVAARQFPELRRHGWAFIQIGKPGSNDAKQDETDVVALTTIASNYWATLVRVAQPDGVELHGRLDQRRYWTRTEARQAALRWLRSPLREQP